MDLISKLSHYELILAEEHLKCMNPDDAKYWKTTAKISSYLSAHAEWLNCAFVQKVLLKTRVEFGQAEKKHLREVEEALPKISSLNMALLEDKLNHDQLAVIEELGRFVSLETKSLLHPGTTSYDILDTVRSFSFKKCWYDVFRPKVKENIEKLCKLAEEHMDLIQVGRTHLQNTSPVTFGGFLAGYVLRLAEGVEKSDLAFNNLRGKISGIVGTGASIEAVIGAGKALEFEKCVLSNLGLKPDPAATQIVQKEGLVSIANEIASLMGIIANFSNNVRMLYSSAIGEVTSLDSAKRLGGSSADASKNNPIHYENIAGKLAVICSGLPVVREQVDTDFQRDLRNSVQARYEPQLIMTRTYESFCRLSKALDSFFVYKDVVDKNLIPVRNNPSEAMTAIARAHGYIHPKLGIGHDVVKEFSKQAKTAGKSLLEVALEDEHFKAAFESWPEVHQKILNGELELYLGQSKERAIENIAYARRIK